MTGTEHTIEKAAKLLAEHPSIPNFGDGPRYVCPTCGDTDVAGPNSPSHAAHQARALHQAGLLAAPTVSRDEVWRVVAAHDPGDDEMALSRVNRLTDALWSLVSGSDEHTHNPHEIGDHHVDQ